MLQNVNFFLKMRLKIVFFVNYHYLHGEPKKVAHIQKMWPWYGLNLSNGDGSYYKENLIGCAKFWKTFHCIKHI